MPEQTGVQDKGENFTASVSETFSESLFDWKAGEEISVNGYIYKTTDEGAEATFVAVDKPAPESDEYFAFFPSDLTRYGKGVKAVMPSVLQLDGVGVIPRECAVSVAKASSRSLVFEQILAFVSVDIETDGLSKITITSNGGEPLSGAYTADYSDKNPYVFVTDGNPYISVVKADGTTFTKGERIYFACVPTNLKSGFTFAASFESKHSVKHV